MTVCIAAICHGWGRHMVVGASDRMVSGQVIAFEPDRAKVFRLGDSIAALTAGSAPVQHEICEMTRREVQELAEPYPSVQSVAEVYCDSVAKYKLQLAEHFWLKPLGLSMDGFVRDNQAIPPGLADKLLVQVQGTQIPYPGIETLVCGVDHHGAHIFSVDNDGMKQQQDGIGFAAIGSGATHANPYLMFSGLTPNDSFARALFIVYSAKRRSEVCPSVGGATDLFFFGPSPGDFSFVSQDIITILEQVYSDVDEQVNVTRLLGHYDVESRIDEYLQQFSEVPEAEETDSEDDLEESSFEAEVPALPEGDDQAG